MTSTLFLTNPTVRWLTPLQGGVTLADLLASGMTPIFDLINPHSHAHQFVLWR